MNKSSRVVRRTLQTSAVVAILVGASSASAESGTGAPPVVTKEDRPVEPLAGRIRTFAGDVTGTAGRIRTFEGAAAGSAGRIRTFAGSVAGFAGRIRTFQGETMPSIGVNTAFWGNLQAVNGALAPSAGRIRTFSGDLEGSAGRIRTFAGGIRALDGSLLSYNQAKISYDGIAAQIKTLITQSKAAFGPAVEAESGQSFDQAFVQRMLGKYGINLGSPSSLYGLSEVDIELFLLDWNDNLMNYSGRDQVDHWMKTVNWSPSLTQQVTGGVKARIGLLDFTVTGSETANIIQAKGISTVAGGHGAAVASLLVSAHDGKGVMGIAPNAQVVSYNPFDQSYTAGWADITTGIKSFIDAGVSVVNISLGVPGWTLNDGWNGVFADPLLNNGGKRQLYVFAAGNDGVVQPSDIEWAAGKNKAIIVVGSVDPSENISAFSNTPGNTCLLTNGVCQSPEDRLMNRFIVAPGEFILVADGQGGVTRLSGTSFAAPLVAGTATLIADRWPWLGLVPNDIANIILKSAKDLGAPGVDAVYGNGLLDVTAALSPKDFNSLQSWSISVDGAIKSTTAATIASTAISSKSLWEAQSAYVTVFESTTSSFRDFVIPLSSKLIGQTNFTDGRPFQAYLQSRFWGWVSSQAPTPSTSSPTSSKGNKKNFVDYELVSPLYGFGGAQAALTFKPRAYQPGVRRNNITFDGALSLATADNRVGFQFGSGNGAMALGGNNAFGLSSDYDVETGGANPFLSLASGSAYASVRFALNSQVTVSTGVTAQNSERDLRGAPSSVVAALARVEPYKASANNLTLTYQPTSWLTATTSYTLLREKTSLLGVQSLDANDFRGGTTTDAATSGLDIAVTPSLSVGAAATVGRTRSGDNARQNIVVSSGGAVSTAFQFVMTKSNLFGNNDSARISVSQPLHIERGSIDFASVQVVDRQTGQLGVVTQTIGLQSGSRSYVTEAIYRSPMLDGLAEFNLFGRARIGGDPADREDAALTVGAAFRLAL